MGLREYVLTAMNHVRRWRGQEVVVYSPTDRPCASFRDAHELQHSKEAR